MAILTVYDHLSGRSAERRVGLHPCKVLRAMSKVVYVGCAATYQHWSQVVGVSVDRVNLVEPFATQAGCPYGNSCRIDIPFTLQTENHHLLTDGSPSGTGSIISWTCYASPLRERYLEVRCPSLGVRIGVALSLPLPGGGASSSSGGTVLLVANVQISIRDCRKLG